VTFLVVFCWFLLTSVVWHLRFRSYLALRVSPRWRVTFFLQLKKVTKKSRPYSFAPRKAFGVPEFSGIAYEPALMRRPGAQG
jgi:hypothetical protein